MLCNSLLGMGNWKRICADKNRCVAIQNVFGKCLSFKFHNMPGKLFQRLQVNTLCGCLTQAATQCLKQTGLHSASKIMKCIDCGTFPSANSCTKSFNIQA